MEDAQFDNTKHIENINLTTLSRTDLIDERFTKIYWVKIVNGPELRMKQRSPPKKLESLIEAPNFNNSAERKNKVSEY